MSGSATVFVTTIRVRPRHCDAQGMVHAARYYLFFEEAFLQWMSSLGLDYATLRTSGADFVIVESRCTYRSPARLDDELRVSVTPAAVTSSTVTVEFSVSRNDTSVAIGAVVYVALSDGAATSVPPAIVEADAATSTVRPIDRRRAERVLQRLHDAQAKLYSGGGAAEVSAVLVPDVVWRVPGHNAIAGVYRGVREVVDYMERRRDLARGTFTMHPRELLVGDGHVASLTDGSVRRDGSRRTWSTIGLYRLDGDAIAECHLVPLDQAIFDEVWA